MKIELIDDFSKITKYRGNKMSINHTINFKYINSFTKNLPIPMMKVGKYAPNQN